MYRADLFRVAVTVVAIVIAGCNPRVDSPQVGVYRAVLRLPGGDTPFGFEVAQEQQQYVIYLTNGTERTRVSNVKVANGELTAVFPGYENSVRATMHRDGLEGSVTLIKAGGKEQVIPFAAKLGETYRFYPQSATDNADVDGTWEATFTNDKGETSKALLLLKQQHDHVSGSALTPTGDHRFLEGQMRGDELQLSTFAGGLAYLYKLKVDAKGGLEGEYWQGLASHEKVSARRNDAATLDGAGKQTAMRDSTQLLNFTVPDVDGSGRVSSIHTGFAGPATGRHYDEHVKEFRDEVEQLLAVGPAG